MSILHRRLRRTLRALARDERGNVAIIFGLALLPTLGFVGVAVDYSQALTFKEYARGQSDAAALTVASNTSASASAIARAKEKVAERYGTRVENLDVTGDWITSGNYRVVISADVRNTILAAVPGMMAKTPVSVETVVELVPPQYATLPPELSQLSPEAADYNRLYMYCYDDERRNEPDKGRRAMTAIADNGGPGLDYSRATLPTCRAGEIISYKLRNIRNARSDSTKWGNAEDELPPAGQEVYEYYTDTTMDRATRVQKNRMSGGRIYRTGAPTPIDMEANPILETILCNTRQDCRPKSEGGILPNNHETGRTPATASGGCQEGKYLYFGWEDRPPTGSSDRDYDDIRLVVKCPQEVKTADKQIRIVK
ncbi:MAG TPA: pilus assembly protein TadG-related protein [Microvirga sp.]|jgi:Flp pilus assembly protein TadG|nr:pilus assembly protein TadG-related protein [Microvirga sp.]